MRRRTIALLVAAMLLGASPARASEASTIIERCTHGQPLGGFSQNGYREALKQVPTELSEYDGECISLIRKAELAATGGAAGAGLGGSALAGATSNVPLPLTPAEQAEVSRAHREGSAPILVGKALVKPGVVSANIASAASALPTSLVGVLALLLACALLFLTKEIHERVRSGRSD